MIRAIQRFFNARIASRAGQADADSEHALHLATAALFIEVMRADFAVKEEERAMVVEAVREALALSPEETAELVQLAEEEARQSVSLFEFTRLVDRGFSPDQKKEVVELLWRIALADSHLEMHEEYTVRKIAGLLHVPHQDFIEAKRRARQARS
jgi:uncharacterized tellurite resistance protein B-like protein